MQKGRIYLSGGITQVADYQRNFDKAEEYIKMNFPGTDVINPTMVKLPESCTHEDYMKICIPLLELADTIYMLRGWEKSKGACIEYGFALGKDKTIIFEEA